MHAHTDGTSCSDAYIDNRDGAGATPNNGNVDYLGLRVRMQPRVFHSLAMPLPRSQARTADGLKKYMLGGGKIASPMLYVEILPEWEDGDFTPAVVRGHEGRNRMYALSELCGPDEMVEVHIILERGYRARHLKPAWIEALQHSMYAQGALKLVPGPLFVTERDLTPNRGSRRRSSKNRRRTSRKR